MLKMMKIFSFAILLSVFFLGTDGGIDAGFHGTGLICNKCHTIHYSEDGESPPTTGFGPAGTSGADPGGPFPHLLVKEHSTELCLTCHIDGQGGDGVTPDVHGADSNGLTERSAGFFADVDAVNANGHNLAEDKLSSSNFCLTCHFGGDFNTAKIGCISCHEPHGRDPSNPDYRYRNLQWASNPGGEPIITAFVKSGVTGLAVYERSNIGYAAPTTVDWREVTNICLDCHHTFSGYFYTRDGGEHGTCIRHPNTDSERGAREAINKHTTGGTDPTHWQDGIGIGFSIDRLPFIVSGATSYAEATTVAQNNEVFCLTCHKAHGNGNNSAMRWSYREDSNLGCQQCHSKGN